MKKVFTILGVAGLFFTVNAQNLLTEPFAFSGAVSGQNGWATHSGNTPQQIVTTAGSLSYAGITSSGNSAAISSSSTEDINKPLTSTPSSGAVYYSALINPLNTTGLSANTSTTGDYFFHLGSMSTTATPALNVFTSRLYIKKGSATDTVNLGVLNASGGTATPTFGSADYPINQTIYVVVKYDIATNTSTLYVNPSTAAEPTTPTATNATGTGAAPSIIEYFCVREGSNTGNIQFDEIKVSTSYAGLLAVSDISATKAKFIKNTLVENELKFSSKSNVQITNAAGQTVMTAAVGENSSLDVSSLAKGMYIVTGVVDGTKISQKIIKK